MSRSALYSIAERNLGSVDSILGWDTEVDGSEDMNLPSMRNRKKVLTAFSFLETDFGVYFCERRESRKLSISEVLTIAGVEMFFAVRKITICSRSARYARMVDGDLFFSSRLLIKVGSRLFRESCDII